MSTVGLSPDYPASPLLNDLLDELGSIWNGLNELAAVNDSTVTRVLGIESAYGDIHADPEPICTIARMHYMLAELRQAGVRLRHSVDELAKL
jgi:hypothetical protein